VNERNTVITASHLIDDYLTSRNIAKYGLKFTTLMEVSKRLGMQGYFWHQYTVDREKKVAWMKAILDKGYVDDNGQKIQGWEIL
jgi:hypothetical protein